MSSLWTVERLLVGWRLLMLSDWTDAVGAVVLAVAAVGGVWLWIRGAAVVAGWL